MDLYTDQWAFPIIKTICQFYAVGWSTVADFGAGTEGKSGSDLAHLLEKGENRRLQAEARDEMPHPSASSLSDQHRHRDFCRLIVGNLARCIASRERELGGMKRVTGFTQDDEHLFCTEEQGRARVNGCLELVEDHLRSAGYEGNYRVAWALRDPDSAK